MAKSRFQLRESQSRTHIIIYLFVCFYPEPTLSITIVEQRCCKISEQETNVCVTGSEYYRGSDNELCELV